MSHRVVRTKNRWTTAQLELLVTVWEKYYQHLKAGRGNEEIYEMMVDELKSAGCLEATVKQVRGRIHNLSGKYRKEASEVMKTGKPSQWSLYNKISNFFEYTAPVRFKNLGGQVYDMSDYIQMDLIMTEAIEKHASSRKRAGQYEDPREFELEENSMDIEDDELEPDEDSLDVDRPDQEEYSDAVQYDDENAVDEFPAIEDRESDRSGAEKANVPEQSEPERSEPKDSVTSDTDSDADSLMDDDDDCFFEEPSKKKSRNQVFHIKSSFRQAAIEDFLSLLYSNQMYADVMLITCHEGVTCVMPAHRTVLANFSEFFSSVLGALKPNTNGNPLTVCLQPDISQPVMQLLLQFMYTGKATVAEELMGDFLRCGHILRIRGLWSEEKAESVDERVQQPSEASVGKATNNDDFCASSIFDEDRSSASSTVTVIAPSSRDSSNDTEQRSERSRKRRKKLTKKAKKIRSIESDQEMEKLEVSSEIGFDLLRSDTEGEDKKKDENDKQTDSNVPIKDTADNVGDGFDANDHEDVEDDYDDDDDYIEGESIADGEEDEDEDFGTEYIDTDTETDTDADYEICSIVNGDSVSNLSTPAALTPEPVPESAPDPEAIAEKKNIKPNDQIKQNGNVNGCSPHDEESQESSPSHDEVRSEHETAVAVKPIPKVQAATKPPDIRRTLRTVPSTTVRIQQSSHKQTNSQTDQSSKPERYSNQQTYAIQSTSRGQFLAKVRSLYSCKICGTRFNTSDGWVEHVVYTHSKGEQLTDNNSEGHLTMLQCDLCNKFLASEYDWVHHILKKHTERYPHFYEDLSMSDE
ncbi:uncharacterized protein LOC125770353 [Anopheles funestus]|uniref:uncharacterized protein LOC125770353 n=1 Tax=Anopheles funestus TaxID=62324 RepID=UPI0020C6F464|nr:uncharacterized protein LOC125770353 [Anopheles funestus]